MRRAADSRVRVLRLAAALAFAAALAALLFAPLPGEAQCAMCKTAVRAGGEQAARTINKAMLVLLIPPVTIFCSIFFVFMKYKNGRDEASEADDDGGR